jgi:Tol biopolymer transport system component/DNA-binding winged helix-turn-helix (wHTH) protein
MHMAYTPPARGYSFGPFILDPVRRLLWSDGSLVSLTPRAFDILLLVLERRSQIVDKDQLLSAIWGDTVVEEATVVRHVSTLRKALHLRPDQHDVLVTIPGRGYRFVASVTTLDGIPATLPTAPSRNPADAGEDRHNPVVNRDPPRMALPVAAGTSPARSRLHLGALWAVTCVCLVGASVAWITSSRLATRSEERDLLQFTYDAGAPRDPSWSPDGQRLAFTSDRDGKPYIWLQGIHDPRPVRLTTAVDAESEPDFSPDGRSIAFRSERDGGGIYVVPSSGGADRLLSKFGYHPLWSPDGRHIVFVSTPLRVSSAPRMYLVDPEAGTAPRGVLEEALSQFSSFSSAWHPDGRRISIWGRQRNADDFAFVTVPIDGGTATTSTLSSDVRRWMDASHVTLGRFVWARTATALYFEGSVDRVRNIWRVQVDPQTLAWIRTPERLTNTAAQDRDLVLSADGRRLAFVSRTEQTRLWSFPIESNGQLVASNGEPVTQGDGADLQATVSARGDRMIYQTVRGGYSELRSVSLVDHSERLLASGTDQILRAIGSPDGGRVAYWTRSGGLGASKKDTVRNAAFVVLNPSGRIEAQYALTGARSTLMAEDWSSDGRTILGSCGRPIAICSLDVSSPGLAPAILASDPQLNLYQAHFSRSARWIVFMGENPKGGGASRVYVAPATGGPWVPITDGQAFDDKPRWSSDDRTIYYLSNRGTFINVWARKFDPIAGQPIGEAVRVTSFTSARRMISPDRISSIEIGVATNRLVLPVTESLSQIWILESVDR